MIASINKTKEILTKYNLQVKKKFGQNFLIDSNIVNKIIDNARVDDKTFVIEIGPGIGAMTELLVQKAKKVLCFEIDNDMVKILTNELINYQNLEIINADFLKVDIKKYLSNESFERLIVVSNLPYYITTPIIFKLLNEDQIDEIYVMVQEEVALRLISPPNTKDYGSLSVLIKYLSNAKYEFKVVRNCFFPSPNVDSGIVSMKKVKNDYDLKNESKFLKFTQDIFAMRRKTLVNNILQKYNCNRKKIEDLLEENNYEKTVRSESLNLEEIVKIFKDLEKKELLK